MPLSAEEIASIRICTQLSSDPDNPLAVCNRTKDDSSGNHGRLALARLSLWPTGKTLNVLFLGGSDRVRSKVQEYALAWSPHANIHLNFVQQGPSNIRVSFESGGSWSYVGTDNDRIPQDRATMNFGWFHDATDDVEFSRTTIHEFGHALGCVHEHQSPEANIPWNEPVVYDYYAQTQGWTPEQTYNNIFLKYIPEISVNSYFDMQSIMLYQIPAFLTLNGFSTESNTVLSEEDKSFISRVYPR